MSLYASLLLAVVLIGNTTGQMLFKAASLRSARGGNSHWAGLMADPLLWLGIVIYVFEFFLWMAFLSIVPLWQGVMVACIDILLVMVGGRIFFAEHITMPRCVAVALIAIGVLLVGWGGGA